MSPPPCRARRTSSSSASSTATSAPPSGSLPELREVVQATVIDGLTTKEAAGLLGLPQGTVKTRVRAAKSQLRGSLIASKGAL